MKFLSPESKSKRVARITKERHNLTAKHSWNSDLGFCLADKQHHELLEIAHTIQQKTPEAIEELCSRADGVEEGKNVLRESMARGCA